MGHSLFSSFQYTVESKQMFNINKFVPITGFKQQTSGIGNNHSTNWATQPLPNLGNVESRIEERSSLAEFLSVYFGFVFDPMTHVCDQTLTRERSNEKMLRYFLQSPMV